MNALLAIVTLGIGYIIWTMIVWQDGRTPAWQILKMRAVSAHTGQPIDWGTSALRNFVLYGVVGNVSCGLFTLVGVWWVFGDDRQTLWDKIAKTYVVKEN